MYARITIYRTRVEISLKKSIHSDYWNKGKGCAKGSNPESRLLNTYLNQVQGKLTDCYRELQLNDEIVTANAVKQLLFGDNPGQHSLTDSLSRPFTVSQNDRRDNTELWSNKKIYFFLFRKKRNISDIYLIRIDYKFIIDFDFFLHTKKSV